MAARVTALLCLVLHLAHTVPVPAQEGDLPAPCISAAPGPVVPWKASLRILCQGMAEAFLYQLLGLENSTLTVLKEQLGFQLQAEFVLGSVDASAAGQYWCRYRKGRQWSKWSKALGLVVTGLYSKPFLSMGQHSMLTSGDNVTFQCHSANTSFDRFALAKEGDASLPQHQHEGHQGSFTLSPLNPSFTGKYICYGWHSSSPHVWSAPSEALELIITEPETRKHTVENAVRLGVAALVLAALVALGADHWRSHRAECTEFVGRGDLPGSDWGARQRGPGPGPGGHR